MSSVSPLAPNPVTEVDAYIASLFAALGSRDPFEVLAGTPSAIRAMLEGVPGEQLRAPEAPGKWSVTQVVMHLADSEIVGAFRFRMVLAHDQPPIPGYDQDLWANRLKYSDANMTDALDQFTGLRVANVRLLRATSPAERERFGVHAERGQESIGKMIRMYAGHDLVHLRQMGRILRAVGG
jgi:hypothetical protein